jgi:hypothetical protein
MRNAIVTFGLVLGVVLALEARPAIAQEHPQHAPPAYAAVDTAPHPTLSSDSEWAGIMVIVIVACFGLAAITGASIRALTPEELPPPAHSHDEPPGASGHHGHGGTADTGHHHTH